MNVQTFASKTGLSAHTIRYYDRIGLFDVQRNPQGYREFSEQDILWAGFIQHLKETSMPLEQIKHYRDLLVQGSSTTAQRKQLLEAHAEQLESRLCVLQEHLEKLRLKIASYDAYVKAERLTES